MKTNHILNFAAEIQDTNEYNTNASDAWKL